jgi:hypothetical protein
MELSDSKVLTLPGGFKLAVESDHGPPGFQGSKYPTPYISGWLKKMIKSSNELGYLHIEVGRPAGGAVCEG